ncbi:ATP-binding protein [Vibrio sp. S4M6]|uniref:AAA family ATPase n=1 Tax=Vibrio sinus TaxID=2946865 RepID=UPI002029FC6E|nr:AAA family ATPase [Vibrio sinus]MCL9783100.1 ATP-binding protein [Vibrio sinus]
MNISFIGAQGTGKTTALNQLVNRLDKVTHIIPDQYRNICQDLNYSRPRDIVLEEGLTQSSQAMSAFVSTALASFSQLSVSRTEFNLADLDPISYYAFYEYWITRSAKENGTEPTYLPFIKKLAQHYSELFDINFYFPIGVIPLVGDEMRAVDLEFQSEIDKIILKNLDDFKPHNVITIESDTEQGRCEEMLEWISNLTRS